MQFIIIIKLLHISELGYCPKGVLEQMNMNPAHSSRYFTACIGMFTMLKLYEREQFQVQVHTCL